MFGRDKTSAPVEPKAAPANVVKEGGKGRPTPTRREAELRNRRSLIGPAPQPVKGATREERKVQRNARRAVLRQQRLAAANGEEGALGERDRGPIRRFARDYVDARRNLGEMLLPVTLVAFLLRAVPGAQLISLVLLYATVVAVCVDTYLLGKRVQRLANERFKTTTDGKFARYVMLRAIQFRRARVPRPLVKRGQFPDGAHK